MEIDPEEALTYTRQNRPPRVLCFTQNSGRGIQRRGVFGCDNMFPEAAPIGRVPGRGVGR